MTFADKVKYVRMKLYLSQAQLAKEIGVSFATVNRWESKGYEPQLASLGRFNDFCEKHGITPTTFIGESKNEIYILRLQRYGYYYMRRKAKAQDYLLRSFH